MSKDAVERQMSHMERNSVRAAYIHKAEFIDERKLMLQWWADFLDANLFYMSRKERSVFRKKKEA
ncbi:integrase [Salmonella enterica subsp. enterica serovar Goldcoast]|nr:integrase [Salmonella enterica subsp. enterica serovar Goldcoast]